VEIQDANTKIIYNEIQNLSIRVAALPTTADVRLAVVDGIQMHEDRCAARKLQDKVADNTARIDLVTRVRNSIVPAKARLKGAPTWAKILVPLALAAAGSLLGVGTGM